MDQENEKGMQISQKESGATGASRREILTKTTKLNMKRVSNRLVSSTYAAAILLVSGCVHSRITAVDISHPDVKIGMPYYLPKPYLIVTKNIRYIPTPTVGLTQTVPIPNVFDTSSFGGAQNPSGGGGSKSNRVSSVSANSSNKRNQSSGTAPPEKKPTTPGTSSNPTNKPPQNPAPGTRPPRSGTMTETPPSGSINNQVLGPPSIAVVPPGPIPDGLAPDTFYTYQIVYLPDRSRTFGLKVKGGAGEMRATLNMVNGWMFTGPGPLYMRDSSSAQQSAAVGDAVSSILTSAANLATSIYGGPAGAAAKSATSAVAGAIKPQAQPAPGRYVRGEPIPDYAEIWVFDLDSPQAKQVLKFSRDLVAFERGTPDVNDQGDQNPPDPMNLLNQVNSILKDFPDLGDVKAVKADQVKDGYKITLDKKPNPLPSDQQKQLDQRLFSQGVIPPLLAPE